MADNISGKVSKKKQKEAVEEVVQYLRDHGYRKAEAYLRRKPTLEEKFEWLIKLKWTFAAPPVPTSQDIESLLNFFQDQQQPSGPTQFIKFIRGSNDLNYDYESVNRAYEVLNELLTFGSLDDWMNEEDSLMEFPFTYKDRDNEVIEKNRELHINERRHQWFEDNLKDTIEQLNALNQIYVRIDEIIKLIKPNVSKGPGRRPKYPFLKSEAQIIWDKYESEIIERSSNENNQVELFLEYFPELKRRVAKYEKGDKENGVPFQTVRSWIKKWIEIDAAQ